MSTIERALEKQRQAEQQKQQLKQQQDEILKRQQPISSTIEPEVTATSHQSHANQLPNKPQPAVEQGFTTAPPPPKTPIPTNHYQPPLDQLTQQTGSPTPDRGHLRVNIDIPRLEALGMVSPTENFTQIKEEYRYIKRPLLNNAFGPGASTLNQPNLVMVSSSFSGEGKTFTTVNLAMSMALEEDRKVLLVDADVIKPHVCERLGIPEQAGLMDYLTGKVEVSDIILETNIPNLKLITAGRSAISRPLAATSVATRTLRLCCLNWTNT